MKKLIVTMLCAAVLLSTPIYAGAQEIKRSVGEGYTSAGVYYTVYELQTVAEEERAVGDKITAIREFQFSGIIQPPAEKNYTEYIDGICYSGVLKLYAFTYENGNTMAVYKGTLTAVN